ncbi:hypothetical protein X925_09815 [Petrotoga sp. 9T1HF07.CasAA.8.2]|nr:hypothetical protein X925_09815 [Petrotoga sp. 9T1HF07.CasAA.8.2]PNR91706.1 hypothetical protein X926_08275 [Petrotoga sp. HWHPT.55.6.3]
MYDKIYIDYIIVFLIINKDKTKFSKSIPFIYRKKPKEVINVDENQKRKLYI